MTRPMTPSEIGTRSELAVMAALATAGQHVVVPFGGHLRYDLAFEHEGRLIKVQCKSGHHRKGVIAFHTANRTFGVPRDYRKDADLFGVYCHTRREVYLVPIDDVPVQGAYLRVEPPRNNQKAGIRMAAPYLVRDGRLPDAVIQRFSSSPAHNRDSSPAHTPRSRPSRITSSLNRQISMFECTLASTDIDSGGDMAIPLLLAEDEVPVACCSPLATPKLDDDAAEATATLFKALGDPHRVRVVNLLLANPEPVCVCDITAYLGLAQSTVSFHLKKLVNAGLLRREQRGTWAYYSIDPEAMRTLRTVVDTKGVAA